MEIQHILLNSNRANGYIANKEYDLMKNAQPFTWNFE